MKETLQGSVGLRTGRNSRDFDAITVVGSERGGGEEDEGVIWGCLFGRALCKRLIFTLGLQSFVFLSFWYPKSVLNTSILQSSISSQFDTLLQISLDFLLFLY